VRAFHPTSSSLASGTRQDSEEPDHSPRRDEGEPTYPVGTCTSTFDIDKLVCVGCCVCHGASGRQEHQSPFPRFHSTMPALNPPNQLQSSSFNQRGSGLGGESCGDPCRLVPVTPRSVCRSGQNFCCSGVAQSSRRRRNALRPTGEPIDSPSLLRDILYPALSSAGRSIGLFPRGLCCHHRL
jgi:hypothetical protein